MRRSIVLFGVVLSLSLTAAAGPEGGLQYQLPRGWVDLLDPETETAGYPPGLLNVARHGPYVMYAVDPQNLSTVGANASLNIIESRGKLAVTQDLLRETTRGASREAQKAGYQMNFTSARVVKLGDVDVGRTVAFMSNDAGTVKLLQFLIPGKDFLATLTYACRPEEFTTYEPIFEQAAMATTGAYKHAKPGIDWGRAAKTGAIAGALGGLVALLVSLAKKKQPAPAMPQQASMLPPAAPSVWGCAACGRRVPMRVEQCRCGTLRPA